jgi:hypothetical protein
MNRLTSYALHIKPLFRPLDIEHGTYDGVKANADEILNRVRDNDAPMPPAVDGGPWPDEWVALFERWIAEGHLP